MSNHDRKSVLLSKKKQRNVSIQSDEELKTYKNQNVVFQIHSPKGQENYCGKSFPAKFSINITNDGKEVNQYSNPMETNEGFVRTSRTNEVTQTQAFAPSISKIQNTVPTYHRNSAPRFSSPSHGTDSELISVYEGSLQEYKRQYQRLLRESEQAGQRYENYIEKLETIVKDKEKQIQILKKESEELRSQNDKMKKKVEIAQKDTIDIHIYEDLKKRYEEQSEKNHTILEKKLKNKIMGLEQRMSEQQKRSKNRINQLEIALNEKEIILKKITQYNNELCDKVIDGSQKNAKLATKDMQKWLKSMAKVFSSQKSVQSQELVQKCQYLKSEIKSLVHQNNRLETQLLSTKRETSLLQKENQSIKQHILELEKERTRQNWHSNTYPRNTVDQNTINGFRTANNEVQKFEVEEFPIYQTDGVIKVKMQKLLLEKDRTISKLQHENSQIKNENIHLKNQFTTNYYGSDINSIHNSSIYGRPEGLMKVKSDNCFKKHKIRTDHDEEEERREQFRRGYGTCQRFVRMTQNSEDNISENQRNNYYSIKADEDQEEQSPHLKKLKRILDLQQEAYEQISELSRKTGSDNFYRGPRCQTDRTGYSRDNHRSAKISFAKIRKNQKMTFDYGNQGKRTIR